MNLTTSYLFLTVIPPHFCARNPLLWQEK